MWSAKALADEACAHRLQAGHIDAWTEGVPLFSCPHAHMCVRAMPRALGSDLDAGRFHLMELGSGLVTSPTTALDNSIYLVSHQHPQRSVRDGHIGPLRTKLDWEVRSSGMRSRGKAPACLGGPRPRSQALRVSLTVSSINWVLVPPLRTNSCTAMST